MSDKCYMVFWDRDEYDRMYQLPGGDGWTDCVFEAGYFTFNLAASEYFGLCEKNPNSNYGVISFEAKLTEVSIEVTNKDDNAGYS